MEERGGVVVGCGDDDVVNTLLAGVEGRGGVVVAGGGNKSRRATGGGMSQSHRTVTDQAYIHNESGGLSGRLSAADISCKRDFLAKGEHQIRWP